ncbi:MAG: 1-acyl-sn-glycerol-3-phosphate acyltransferase, partial [Legionellales bacterium]
MSQGMVKKEHYLSALVKFVLAWWFQVEVNGHYQPRPKAVIIANRASVIDLLLLSVFLPERLTVALPQGLLRPFSVTLCRLFADVLVVDSTNAFATRGLIQALRAGKPCLIFPEGVAGHNVYDATAFILQKSGADMLPIRIEGSESSVFSINKDKHRIRFFPKIRIHILPVQHLAPINQGRAARKELSVRLFRVISELHFANSFQNKTLFPALIEGSYLGSRSAATIEDSNRTPLTYKQFRIRCFILGRQIKNHTQVQERVGVMMPTTTAGMVTFFALHAYRRIPAMINFSMGFYNLISACATAEIKTIYTSKQFIATAKLETLIEELQTAGLGIRYLEDFKPVINLGHKLAGFIKGLFPTLAYRLIG